MSSTREKRLEAAEDALAAAKTLLLACFDALCDAMVAAWRAG